MGIACEISCFSILRDQDLILRHHIYDDGSSEAVILHKENSDHVDIC